MLQNWVHAENMKRVVDDARPATVHLAVASHGVSKMEGLKVQKTVPVVHLASRLPGCPSSKPKTANTAALQ